MHCTILCYKICFKGAYTHRTWCLNRIIYDGIMIISSQIPVIIYISYSYMQQSTTFNVHLVGFLYEIKFHKKERARKNVYASTLLVFKIQEMVSKHYWKIFKIHESIYIQQRNCCVYRWKKILKSLETWEWSIRSEKCMQYNIFLIVGAIRSICVFVCFWLRSTLKRYNTVIGCSA